MGHDATMLNAFRTLASDMMAPEQPKVWKWVGVNGEQMQGMTEAAARETAAVLGGKAEKMG